jgi:hypothetical protein
MATAGVVGALPIILFASPRVTLPNSPQPATEDVRQGRKHAPTQRRHHQPAKEERPQGQWPSSGDGAEDTEGDRDHRIRAKPRKQRNLVARWWTRSRWC